MRNENSLIISRQDYRPYPYRLAAVRLVFELDAASTRVKTELDFVAPDNQLAPLELYGQDLTLESVSLQGRVLQPDEYTIEGDLMRLQPNQPRFTVTVTTQCSPRDNTMLMGLYASGDQLFTQCEAQGFRRITWFPDRPDVLSVYHVTLRADKKRYPVLLSNGNLISQRDLDDGRHEAVWEDPHPKPSYLFAVVAGQFSVTEKHIETASGRPALLQIYRDAGTPDTTGWAMESLERALRWDEARFGLELDLDRFMIVAARDFNMGAMENKGLNVFNSSYVLACKDSATDAEFRTIEAVIGHEYFHNWTGNRVTCRDWFQLSLKEGLTVFREQEFSADMLARGLDEHQAASARAVKRIADVDILRTQQFPEDASPMAHPIRPESYEEISNFYTATIYEKGAEIIRMLCTLLGRDGFAQGLAEYFRRHDGQAVTCDDFLDAMESVYAANCPGRTLDAFRQWYRQAGTPRVTVDVDYDTAHQRCALRLTQHNPPVGLELAATSPLSKPPLHIPVAIGFLAPDGQALPVQQADTDTHAARDTPAIPDARADWLLELDQQEHVWHFEGVTQRPVLSLLRGFSAPVIVEYSRSPADLALLARHDTDAFARREAAQELVSQHILMLASDTPETPTADDTLVLTWKTLLDDDALADDYLAHMLSLPSVRQLVLRQERANPVRLHQARRAVSRQLGQALHAQWHHRYAQARTVASRPWRPNPTDAGQRALAALALRYLLAGDADDAQQLAHRHYRDADNLTDRLNALSALTENAPESASRPLLLDLHERGRHNPQILDHWYRLQAGAAWATVDSIRRLMQEDSFSLRNPNRMRALLFQFFLGNPAASSTAAAYDFWADQILELDALNPEVAARLARGLERWAAYDVPFSTAMQRALQTVQTQDALSANVKEVVTKALRL